MPELPEVENIRLTLARNIVGQEIKEFEILWPDIFINETDSDPNILLIGKKVESIGRRGKYLLINIEGGATLILHFRMTGKLIYYPEAHEPDKHTHAVFRLENGQLHHSDIRKFGRIQLIETGFQEQVPAIAKLGPEPLDDCFTIELFGQKLSGKKSNIKAALLDQVIIAGIGNIYADEALFRAGIRPDRKTKSLKVSEVILLYDAIQKVLKEGIKAGGTSFRDYRDGDGNKGVFQENLYVYGRAGQTCKKCGSVLEKEKIAGRTSVYCPECQK